MRLNPGKALPNIGYLSGINLAANSADQIATVALPVVYVSTFNGDAGDTSLLTIAATLPMLLFSLPLGSLADRSQLRKVLFCGELVRLVSLVGMVALLTISSPPLAIVALLAMLGATGTVAFQVAAPSLVARSTNGEARLRLNSSIELARSIAVTAGPPLAGVLVSLAGGGIAFALAAGFAFFAMIDTRLLPSLPATGSPASGSLQSLTDGIRFTITNRWLRPILVVALAFNMGWYVLLGVIVAWADGGIGISPTGIGVMFGTYGVGMIAGALLLPRLRSRVRSTSLVQVGPWCGFGFAVMVALSYHFREAWILMVAFFLIGCGPIIWTITTMGIRQSVTPHALMGRVSASIMMASAGARPVGAGIGYIGYQLGGYPAVFGTAVLLFGIQALVIGRTALASSEPEAQSGIVPAI